MLLVSRKIKLTHYPSLREKFDFIIAAPHDGDAMAHPRTAALLARRLLETGASAIIDICVLAFALSDFGVI